MADSWFTVTPLGHGITAIAEPLREGADVKSYLIEGQREAAIVDTGAGVGDFKGLVEQLTSLPLVDVQTHGHWDHIGACHQFERVLIHPEDVPFLRRGEPADLYATHFGPDQIRDEWLPAGFVREGASIPGCRPTGLLNDGDTVDLGGRALEVVHTPGHAPGAVVLLDRDARILLAGDTLRFGTILLMLKKGDPVAYRQSLDRIVALLDAVDVVYPAHGAPMTPDDVRALRDAYESVWAGNVPSTPERAPAMWAGDIDAYQVDRFLFLTPRDSIGV